MLLAGRTAIVHGAGGAPGAVAAALERAGVSVFHACVDPLDEPAVQAHTDVVAGAAGGIDIAVIAPLREDLDGIPLADRTVADLVRPAVARLASAFIGARAAARLMARQGAGVVLVVDDGTGPAGAAVATLVRDLDAEVGSRGVRCASVRRGAPGDVVAAAARLLGDRGSGVSAEGAGVTAVL